MIAQKRNRKDRVYETYNLYKGTKLLAELDEKVQCAECGHAHSFGAMYTSMAIHTDIGLGYPVCDLCYKNEIGLKKNYPHD